MSFAWQHHGLPWAQHSLDWSRAGGARSTQRGGRPEARASYFSPNCSGELRTNFPSPLAPGSHLGGNGSGRLPVVACDQNHIHTHALQRVHGQRCLLLDCVRDGEHGAEHTCRRHPWMSPQGRALGSPRGKGGCATRNSFQSVMSHVKNKTPSYRT